MCQFLGWPFGLHWISLWGKQYVELWGSRAQLSTTDPPLDHPRSVTLGRLFSFPETLRCLTHKAGTMTVPTWHTVHGTNKVIQVKLIKSLTRSLARVVAIWLLRHVLLFSDPVHCSLPGSSVHGISQVRILEWVAISFSRGSSWPRDWTLITCIGRRILYHWNTWEAPGTLVSSNYWKTSVRKCRWDIVLKYSGSAAKILLTHANRTECYRKAFLKHPRVSFSPDSQVLGAQLLQNDRRQLNHQEGEGQGRSVVLFPSCRRLAQCQQG